MSGIRAILFGALSMVGVWGACGGGGGGGISIVGDPPEQQAAEIADAICEQTAECGEVSINCTSSNGTLDCTGTIEPVTYEACVAELEPDLLDVLQGCELTAEEETTLQSCVNAVLGQSCITQAEVDAAAQMLEEGAETVELRPSPPECAQLEAIFEGCAAQ